MRRSRSRPKSTSTTVSIPVSTLTVGTQAANAFTGWTSPAATVGTNSSWGAANTKFISPSDSTRFLAKTTGISRDQEVSAWMQRGTIYLRLTEAGKAIAFTATPEAGGYGVAIYTGYTEGVAGTNGPGGNTQLNTGFITALGALSSVPGYSASSNAGHYWTFGCEGFDIYLKYNGVEFWRTKQFWHLDPGRIALGAQTSYGFRDVTATHKVNVSTYSDIVLQIFDLRDFGMKSLTTTGSISTGLSALNVTSNPGFSVGDRICIATGGEASGGVPGEQGVGGSWPTLKYTTLARMNADTSQITNKVAGVLENGNTYQWNGSTWITGDQISQVASKYLTKILPKAHTATITAIAGTTFTLDTPCVAASTNATVYFDSGQLLANTICNQYAGIRENATISVPEGLNWAFVNQDIAISSVSGISVRGTGIGSTRIVYPTGTVGTSINLFICPSARVYDLEFLGNCRTDKGYFFTFNATTDIWAGAIDSIRLTSCPYSITERIKNKNYSTSVAVTAYCEGSVLRNIEVIHDTGHKQYFQWAVAVTDSLNCTITDISYDCPNLLKGLETFRSSGSVLRRATGRNACFSSNSSQLVLFEDCSIYYEANSGDAGLAGGAVGISNPNPNEPLINLNSNIDNTSGSSTGSGITIRDCDFDVRGRLWTGYGVQVINISGSVTNVLVQGRYPAKPVLTPSGLINLPNMGSDRALVIRSDQSTSLVVADGLRVVSASTYSPFGDLGGNPTSGMTIQNCVVNNQNSGGTQTNNITNAAYEAL